MPITSSVGDSVVVGGQCERECRHQLLPFTQYCRKRALRRFSIVCKRERERASTHLRHLVIVDELSDDYEHTYTLVVRLV